MTSDRYAPDTRDARDRESTPRSPKAAAVQQWESVLEDLPDNAAWAETLREAHIHDSADRREIEDVIEHDPPDEYYLPLADAFHDLKQTFEDVW